MAFDHSDLFLHESKDRSLSSFCFIHWITVKMTKMIMMRTSSAFDLNHIGGPNNIPSMPSFKSVRGNRKKN
jgi:hypothetical protein